MCRSKHIPVIFDEVFTGLYRIGAESAARLLQLQPDIACYGKLLTGGSVPMAVTLASEDVFKAFEGPSKVRRAMEGMAACRDVILNCTCSTLDPFNQVMVLCMVLATHCMQEGTLAAGCRFQPTQY